MVGYDWENTGEDKRYPEQEIYWRYRHSLWTASGRFVFGGVSARAFGAKSFRKRYVCVSESAEAWLARRGRR